MKKLIPNLLFLFTSLALLVINIIRIVNIPITFDETGYGPGSYSVLVNDKFGSANNHILHSVFRKFFVETFEHTLFFLRLDSLIAQVLFLSFSYLICRLLYKNWLWLIGGFIILNLISPHIFNFWGLSRGYALALAFMTISIYYLLRYMKDKKLLFLSISFAGAILSVYSNFGYINYFLTLLSVVVIQRIIFKENELKGGFIKELLLLLIASCVLGLMIIGPLTAVYRNGELSFMGHAGFIEDTVKSLAGFGLYHNPAFEPDLVNRLLWSVIIFTYLSLAFWLYIYIKKVYKKDNVDIETRFGIVFFLLLIIPVISLVAQYRIFRINYLTGRTAFFFIVLFTLQFIYLLYYFSKVSKVISMVSFAIVFTLVCYNFLLNIDFKKTTDWYFNATDGAIFRKMLNESKNKKNKISVCVSWKASPTFKYSAKYFYPEHFYPVKELKEIQGNDTTFDYYYLMNEDINKLPPSYREDTVCMDQGFVLFKRK